MNSFWRYCLSHFEKELPAQQFITWIKPLKVDVDDTVLTLIAPNRFVMQWIRDQFYARIQELAVAHLQQPAELRFVLAARDPSSGQDPAAATAPPVALPAPASPQPKLARDVSRLNPAFTFATFVPGKATVLARAAAAQVAECNAAAYHPLF